MKINSNRFLIVSVIISATLGFNKIAISQEVLPQIVYIKLEQNQAEIYKSSKKNAILGELESISNGNVTQAIQNKHLDKLFTSGMLKKGVNSTDIQTSINELKKWVKVVLPFNQDPIQFSQKWKNRKGIVSITPHFVRKLTELPNDPLFEKYSFIYNAMKFPDGWGYSKSDTSIIIAIVDSGVNYNHEDLKNKLWINRDEIPDNGIDDDKNGWIDDDKGWDFWESGSLNGTIVEDNNPLVGFQDHGTHVAGIAAAETNNSLGISGAGWNAKYMAIKAGGTKDNPNVIAYGYEGIVYAMINGADIINCSWGGNGSSQFEQDIVNAAFASGCIIIAAAGNEDQESIYFPAAYKNVVSVGSVFSSFSKSPFSNYGYDLDVTAVGNSIYSSSFNNDYVSKSGTSMAAPFVSGLAALVKSKNPDWNAKQIINQIRVSSTYTDPSNLSKYNGKLGRGTINANWALYRVYPGFIINDFKLVNSEGGKLRPNQSGVIKITLEQVATNDLETDFTVTTLTSGIALTNTVKKIPNLGLNETIEYEIGISLTEDFSPFTVPVFKMKFQQFSQGYIDYHYVSYDELIYEEHNNSEIHVSMASDGTVGFVDPINSNGGIGFIPKETNDLLDDPQNILYSSSLMIRQGQFVADRAINTNSTDKDIVPINLYEISEKENRKIGLGNAEILHSNVPALQIQTKSFTINEPDVNQVLWINYLLSNPTPNTVDSIFVGMFADWDIDDYTINKVGFIENDNLIYAFNPETEQYAGIALLNRIGGALAIDNAFEGEETDLDFGLYYSSSSPNSLNGFTKAEKLKAMNAGLKKTELVKGTDVSVIIYSDRFDIPAQSKASFGFIWVYGNSLEEMKAQFEAAKTYDLFPITNPETVSNESLAELKPKEFSILGNYPNPFNPSTNLKIESGKSGEVKLEVFDILGKVVSSQSFLVQSGLTKYAISMSEQASGIYFARIYFDGRIYQHKMMLIK